MSGWCGSPVALTRFNGERPVPPNHERSRPGNSPAEGQSQGVKDLRADGTLMLLAIPNLVEDLERRHIGYDVLSHHHMIGNATGHRKGVHQTLPGARVVASRSTPAGFENFWREIGDPAIEGQESPSPSPPDPVYMQEIGRRYATRFLP